MRKISTKELAHYVVDHGKSKTVCQQIAAFLISENRVADIHKLTEAIEQELSIRGSTQVTITSAVKLDEVTKKRLATALGVSRPVFYEIIDQAVLGGAIAQSSDKLLDLTVRHKLNMFACAAREQYNV